MNNTTPLSDPTDWTHTSLHTLSNLESRLRCQICKDFFTAPVITACSHTFCSGCIRRSGSSVNASRKCPLCWAGFEEGQLRKNMVVEELVAAFVESRGLLLRVGEWKAEMEQMQEEQEREGEGKGSPISAGRRGVKRKRVVVNEGSWDGVSPRKTRSQTQYGSRSRVVADSVEPESEDEVEMEQEERHVDGEYQPDDGKVSCPICQQRMPEAQVFTHLDTHSDDKPTTTAPAFGLPNRAQSSTPTMTPLPTLSYSLLSETQLRKKLKELGIPADGNKQTMSRRHTEWRNLVNSNCDSSKPKSKSELLKELNQWERTQNSTNHAAIAKISQNSVMEKDFDRDGWSTNHNSDFQNLIAAAKAKVKVKSQPEQQPTSTDAEQSPVTNGTTIETTVDRNVNKEVPSPAEMPPSSQLDVINLVSPERIQKVNGFSVP